MDKHYNMILQQVNSGMPYFLEVSNSFSPLSISEIIFSFSSNKIILRDVILKSKKKINEKSNPLHTIYREKCNHVIIAERNLTRKEDMTLNLLGVMTFISAPECCISILSVIKTFDSDQWEKETTRPLSNSLFKTSWTMTTCSQTPPAFPDPSYKRI